MKIETMAVHGGLPVDPATRALTAPIHLSTTFERGEDGSFPGGYVYSRSANPNRNALEECLAALEGGAAAAAFSSGSAAAAAVFQALRPGDHVIAPLDAYHGTTKILRDVFADWGLEMSFVDMTDLTAISGAFRPRTALIWVETPSNPLLKITDIAAVAGIASAAGARLVCDSAWSTPAITRPLELGADIVVHATTKYLGGHSDVLGGAVIAKTDDGFFQKVRTIQTTAGAVAAPFDCWLVLRGIRTLPLRMREHCRNALTLALFLDEHPAVDIVHYPGLVGHPGHAIAARQMSAYGGMLSFEVRGGREAAFAVAAGIRLFTRATSLGGTESLIEHRRSVEGPASTTPDGLLRVSVGLENSEDLIDDLRQALDSV